MILADRTDPALDGGISYAPEEAVQAGMHPTIDAPLAFRCIEGFSFRRRPDVLYAQADWSWDLVDRFLCGDRREPQRGDYDSLSAFELDALLSLNAAWRKKQRASEANHGA